MQFAVLNSSKGNSNIDIEFAVEACRGQIVEFCEAYGIDEVPAVDLYTDLSKLPADDIMVVDIVDDLDEPGAAAYHSFAGKPYVKAAAGPDIACKLSHEFLETLGDQTCDRWVPKGDGTEVAAEVADPTQGDTYPVLAVVAGEGRTQELSNYVTPPYWDRTQTGPTNRMGLELEPFSIRPGGYQVVLGRDGNETEVFGDEAGKAAAFAKFVRADSRLTRRVEGLRAG